MKLELTKKAIMDAINKGYRKKAPKGETTLAKHFGCTHKAIMVLFEQYPEFEQAYAQKHGQVKQSKYDEIVISDGGEPAPVSEKKTRAPRKKKDEKAEQVAEKAVAEVKKVVADAVKLTEEAEQTSVEPEEQTTMDFGEGNDLPDDEGTKDDLQTNWDDPENSDPDNWL